MRIPDPISMMSNTVGNADISSERRNKVKEKVRIGISMNKKQKITMIMVELLRILLFLYKQIKLDINTIAVTIGVILGQVISLQGKVKSIVIFSQAFYWELEFLKALWMLRKKIARISCYYIQNGIYFCNLNQPFAALLDKIQVLRQHIYKII